MNDNIKRNHLSSGYRGRFQRHRKKKEVEKIEMKESGEVKKKSSRQYYTHHHKTSNNGSRMNNGGRQFLKQANNNIVRLKMSTESEVDRKPVDRTPDRKPVDRKPDRKPVVERKSQIGRDRGGDRKMMTRSNEKIENRGEPQGPFAETRQIDFQIVDCDSEDGNHGGEPVVMSEGILGREVVPGCVYDFDLGYSRFIELLKLEAEELPWLSKSTKYFVIDQYYRGADIYSIKWVFTNPRMAPKCKRSTYRERVISSEWTGDEYQRTIERRYLSSSDVDTYSEYHLIVRIIRLVIPQKGIIYEVIIPREDELYQVPKNIISSLISGSEDFPEGTQFMVRKQLK